LTQKWVNGSATNHGVILWTTSEDTDGKDLRFRSSEYTVFQNLWPKLEITYSTETKTVYFLKDHLGSIRATVLDSIGAPVIGYDDYDPWGYPLAGRTKAIPTPYLQGASKNRFTGKERDEDFGLNWLNAPFRPYVPESGRWVVMDPLAAKYPFLSPYNYAANNPVLFIGINGDSLIVTGSQTAVNAFVSTANSALGGFHTVSVGGNGLVNVTATGQEGQMTPEQSAFLQTLMGAASLDVGQVSIGLVIGSEQVIGGSYGLNAIDMADMNIIGQGALATAAGWIGHELAEQTYPFGEVHLSSL